VQPWPDGDSANLPDRHTGATPQCLVLTCSGSAEQLWTDVTVATRNHLATWPVCRLHYLSLVAGEPWEAMTGGPNSFRRWMLMGNDLATWPRPLPGQRPRLIPPGPAT